MHSVLEHALALAGSDEELRESVERVTTIKEHKGYRYRAIAEPKAFDLMVAMARASEQAGRMHVTVEGAAFGAPELLYVQAMEVDNWAPKGDVFATWIREAEERGDAVVVRRIPQGESGIAESIWYRTRDLKFVSEATLGDPEYPDTFVLHEPSKGWSVTPAWLPYAVVGGAVVLVGVVAGLAWYSMKGPKGAMRQNPSSLDRWSELTSGHFSSLQWLEKELGYAVSAQAFGHAAEVEMCRAGHYDSIAEWEEYLHPDRVPSRLRKLADDARERADEFRKKEAALPKSKRGRRAIYRNASRS